MSEDAVIAGDRCIAATTRMTCTITLKSKRLLFKNRRAVITPQRFARTRLMPAFDRQPTGLHGLAVWRLWTAERVYNALQSPGDAASGSRPSSTSRDVAPSVAAPQSRQVKVYFIVLFT